MASRNISFEHGDGFHFYSRRNHTMDKSSHQFQDAGCRAAGKVGEEHRANDGAVNGLDDSVPEQSRNVAWEAIFKTSENSGVEGWIRNAFEYHRTNGFRTPATEEINGDTSGLSNGYLRKREDLANMECQRLLFDVFVSGEFVAICKLLFGNFYGIGVKRLFDLSLIDQRIQEGTYERMPMLFSSDIFHLWKKLEFVGARMVSLAKSLSDMSAIFCKQMRGFGPKDSQERKDEPFASRFCSHDKPHQPDSYSEVRLPHEHCVVCEVVNAHVSTVAIAKEEADEVTTTDDEMSTDIEESSYSSSEDEREKLAKICKFCRVEIIRNEKHLACGHNECPRRYYHERCLTIEQRKTYDSCWYCPSCLCRVCLLDTDDENIVLCDGCDHGYHIHCMNPPLDSIPEGKWFCKKCTEGLQEIARVKSAYKSARGKNIRMKDKDGEQAGETSRKKQRQSSVESPSEAEAMDMLSSAANSLMKEEEEAKAATPPSPSLSIEI